VHTGVFGGVCSVRTHACGDASLIVAILAVSMLALFIKSFAIYVIWSSNYLDATYWEAYRGADRSPDPARNAFVIWCILACALSVLGIALFVARYRRGSDVPRSGRQALKVTLLQYVVITALGLMASATAGHSFYLSGLPLRGSHPALHLRLAGWVAAALLLLVQLTDKMQGSCLKTEALPDDQKGE
jgi:succinate dehydrogenase/fumarate reductase cytochrome b subunit